MRWVVAALAALAVASITAVVWGLSTPSGNRAQHATTPQRPSASVTTAANCPRTVTVVTASSFAPALRAVANPLATGSNCVAVTVRTADGTAAADTVASSHADAWIPDDSSWPKLPSAAKLATGAGAGTVVATSPMYFVTERSSPPLPTSARSWTGLTALLAQQGTWSLAVRDPAASGDGMVAAGGLADAMLAARGPLVSALDLLRAWQEGTTVTAVRSALPQKPDQVGVVPEYALIQSGQAKNYTVIAPTDGTSELRYTWFPTAAAEADSAKAAALTRLYQALRAPSAASALSAAGLRAASWPAAAPSGAAAAGLPAVTAAPTAAISEHFMYHVLATWHPDLRRSNMLIVIDVSGSMGDPAPGTTTPKIALVRQGVAQVDALLPDSAQLGLWVFGSQLAPPNDWQPLVAPAPLAAPQRTAISSAGAQLQARQTGTGLYDTILGAYRYQQAHFQSGMPNEVVLFTDGVNQDDPVSIDLGGLHAGLAAADPSKRVQLSIFGIGNAVPASALDSAVAPVGGQVDLLTSPDEVIGAFVHAVSGALSGVPG